MAIYNATYTIEGAVQPAQLVLLKSKAVIMLATGQEEKSVHWFYHAIKKDATNTSLFTYTTYPPQVLEVLDQSVADALTTHIHQGKKAAVQKRNRTVLTVLAGCVLLVVAVYAFVLPWIVARLVARVPVAYEKKLGDNVYQAMKNDFTIDAARSAYVSAFFDEMHIPSHYAIQITVVKGAVANAFALPGGHIVIYDKLLNQLSSYPQLAALLAHEFSHIEKRHSLKAVFRQTSASLLISMLTGDAGAIGNVVLSNMDNLKSLSYSRSLESEADADGLYVLTSQHIDGAGFTELFRILQKEPAAQAPEWISSHPNLDKRIRNIERAQIYQQQRVAAHTTLQNLFLKIKSD